MRTLPDLTFPGGPQDAVAIEVCGGPPAVPGWIYEPADLLALLSLAEATGWDASLVAPGSDVSGWHHGGAGTGTLLLVLSVIALRRLNQGVRLSVQRWRARTRETPAEEDGARVVGHIGEAADAFTPADPGRIYGGGNANPNARVISMRGGPSPDAIPVTLPPGVAEAMARIRQQRTRAQAHSTYVRAEREPRLRGNAEAAEALRRQLAERRAARAAGEPPRGGKSWVVDD